MICWNAPSAWSVWTPPARCFLASTHSARNACTRSSTATKSCAAQSVEFWCRVRWRSCRQTCSSCGSSKVCATRRRRRRISLQGTIRTRHPSFSNRHPRITAPAHLIIDTRAINRVHLIRFHHISLMQRRSMILLAINRGIAIIFHLWL